jgi:hypothetical protein
MNDDAFEKKLRALTKPLRRPDPTRAWKTDILARARREAEAMCHERLGPPRWLLATWAAAWVVIAAGIFTMPGDPPPPGTAMARLGGAAAAGDGYGATEDLRALLAFHPHLNLNADLPQ